MAGDHYRVSAGSKVIIGGKCATEDGVYSKYGEVRARDHLRVDLLDLTACCAGVNYTMHPASETMDRCKVRKDLVASANFTIGRVRKEVATRIRESDGDARGFGFAEEHQPLGFLNRQLSQHHRVDQAKDGGIGVDAEGKQQHCHRREAFVLEQHSQTVTQVLKHLFP